MGPSESVWQTPTAPSQAEERDRATLAQLGVAKAYIDAGFSHAQVVRLRIAELQCGVLASATSLRVGPEVLGLVPAASGTPELEALAANRTSASGTTNASAHSGSSAPLPSRPSLPAALAVSRGFASLDDATRVAADDGDV